MRVLCVLKWNVCFIQLFIFVYHKPVVVEKEKKRLTLNHAMREIDMKKVWERLRVALLFLLDVGTLLFPSCSV